MVGEFPELQGIMGRYYALADGEPVAVADAIREHYLPRSAGGELPLLPAGTALAIADKLDTLAGIFAIGQKPSGTRDPFGLRRAAIGVLRTLLERRLDLDLRAVIERAVALQPVTNEKSADQVFDYIVERLRSYYLEGAGNIATSATISTEMFDAVLATKPRSPLDFDARLKALAAFLELPEAASLTAANKRIANILRKAEGQPVSEVDVEALRRGRRGAPLRCDARAIENRCQRHPAATIHGSSRASRAAAKRSRHVLRSGDGDGPGLETCGRTVSPC